MKAGLNKRTQIGVAIAALTLVAGGAGYFLGQSGDSAKVAQQESQDGRKVLYWYDPMFPTQKFDQPGKSPFMDMALVPKYAGEDSSSEAPAVTIDPGVVQNLGIRTATAQMGTLGSSLNVTGTIDFNQRHVGIVQARSGGFVQRTYNRAPGDIVGAGAPIADLLIPEWGGAQQEFLAVRRLGDKKLTDAARQRLRLLGMPADVIAGVERTGRTNGVVTVTTPVGGAIQSLDVRPGMALSAGQTLAQVTGLGSVWLNAAVPEARAGEVRIGRMAAANVPAFPGETFSGRIVAILPTAQADSRTLTVRIELANRGLRLRPGMFATVHLGESARTALIVPSEAVIRTGTRTLVMLAETTGRYRPAEIRTGSEANGQTEILAGLRPGEKVVASGQFLIDSEASLSSIPARPIAEAGQ